MSFTRSFHDLTVYRDCSIHCICINFLLFIVHIFAFWNINWATSDHLYIVLHAIIKPTTGFARLIIHVTKAVHFTKLSDPPRCRSWQISTNKFPNYSFQTYLFFVKKKMYIFSNYYIRCLAPILVNIRQQLPLTTSVNQNETLQVDLIDNCRREGYHQSDILIFWISLMNFNPRFSCICWYWLKLMYDSA